MWGDNEKVTYLEHRLSELNSRILDLRATISEMRTKLAVCNNQIVALCEYLGVAFVEKGLQCEPNQEKK